MPDLLSFSFSHRTVIRLGRHLDMTTLPSLHVKLFEKIHFGCAIDTILKYSDVLHRLQDIFWRLWQCGRIKVEKVWVL